MSHAPSKTSNAATTTSKPTAGAMRAARFNRPEMADRADSGEQFAITSLESDAETIDRETGAAELLTLLKEASRRLQTLAVYDAAVFDQQPKGTVRLKAFVKSVESAVARVETT